MPSRPLPKWPTLNIERTLGGRVCGIDEAGYAPIAGPVVAAAVVLPGGAKPRRLRGVTDSKLLTARQRERYFGMIHELCDVGVGIATVAEIDRINILRADMLAMRRAVEGLARMPDAALVDGRSAPGLGCPVRTIVKGDRRSLSIAAASVIAKVVRDRLMRELASAWAGYGWSTNVGYGTDEHYLGLLRHGPSEHHRLTFAPLTTVFASSARPWARFRFGPVDTRPDPDRLELLELRQDLHAVFDGNCRHIGQVKNLRGHWTFRAIGYGDDRAPRAGGGPCADIHGRRLPAPGRRELRDLLSAAL
jgi:ribonuclease HII